MVMKDRIVVYLILILSMLCWAFSYVWIKIAYEVFLPLTTVFLRLLISSILIFLIFGALKLIQKVNREDYKWIFLLAFCEPFLYFLFESFGLQTTSSTTGAVIISTIPLLTPLSAYLFYKEEVNLFNVVGIFISFAGVLVIIVDYNFNTVDPIDGILLMFLAVFAGVGYNLVVKKLAFKYNVFTITGYQNMIGLILFFPLFLVFEWNHFISTPITGRALFSVIELAVFASTLAFLFLTYGIRKIGLSKASIFANLIPVFTAFLAWQILDDEITLKHIVGIAIVISGLLLSQINFKRYVV